MVSIRSDFRDLRDLPEEARVPGRGHGFGHQAKPAAQAAAIAQTGSGSNQAVVALDALNDLVASAAMDESGPIDPLGTDKETYELYGHPDPFQALLAILDRPVGRGVVRTSRTVSVLQSDGTYTNEVQSSAQYVDRQYTGEELVWLDQQDRLKGKRTARVGEADYTVHPEGR